MDLRLTAQQKHFFDTFGYLAFPGLLKDVIDEIIAAFEAVWTAQGGGHNGKPHDGTARSCIVPFIDQSERLSALLDDPRIHGIATSLLGEDFNYMGSDGNFYTGETGWHPDGRHTEMRFLKIAFYLDRIDANSGALRVIPGSHKVGDAFGDAVVKGIQDPEKNFGMHGRDLPCIPLPVTPGDIVLFNHNTLHSSFNGGKRRRMFTMNLCESYPERLLPDLQEYLATHARFLIDRNVGETMLRTAGPQRMRHLKQVMENDFLLTQRTKELREANLEPARG